MEVDKIIWEPNEAWLKNANITQLMNRFNVKSLAELHKKSIDNVSQFWDLTLKDIGIEWYEPYTQVKDDTLGLPWTKWFLNGKINITQNCIDRNAKKYPGKESIIWEGDDGSTQALSYQVLYEKVNQAANLLKAHGIKLGDKVGILMPMIPEVVIQLFACLKIGAVAIPIFSGFGSEAIAQRLQDAEAKLLFTADAFFRRGKAVPIKQVADEALKKVPTITSVIVYKRGTGKCPWDLKTNYWWHEEMNKVATTCETIPLPSEQESLIIFTSGTTGKPKGAIHTHAGCLATIGKELKYSFNVTENSRFFWFTDIGWMMGPWEMIGTTLFGATLFLFEGTPDYPTPSRLWQFIEKNKITTLGISPTAIRVLMKSGLDPIKNFDLKSLNLLGSTGEPWDPESYLWYFENVGKKRCPIINISGGTEIIGCLLTPFPIQKLKPCSLGGPGLGVDVDIFDEEGKSIQGGIGHLVCKQPIPSMTKAFLRAKERYLETYFTKFPGVWYHGDWAHKDQDNHWFLHGRSDDTIKIAGKRIGPSEFESVLMTHHHIAEAAAFGVPDPLKGEAVICAVVVKNEKSSPLAEELRNLMTKSLGKAMAPKQICFVSQLPKTRSGKILRSLLRKIYLREDIKDLSSVDNPNIVEKLKQELSA